MNNVIKTNTRISYITEDNNDDIYANENTPGRGLFIIPSENVPSRTDVTGYVLTAVNKYGKVAWVQSGAPGAFTAGLGIDPVELASFVIQVDSTPRFTFTGNELDLATVTVPYGGTGQTTLTSNGVLIGDSTNPVDTSKQAPVGDFVGTTDTQTLTNKVITDNTNNVTARALFSDSGGNTVSTYASPNPTSGQVLMATSSTTATWQTLPSYTRTVVNVPSYDVLSTDDYLAVIYTTTGEPTLNLPQISSVGKKIYKIIDEGGNAQTNNITINAFAGDTIVGQSSVLIDGDYNSIFLYNDEVNGWFI